MRTLVVTQNITLDGVIDAAGGWFDPTADGLEDVRDVVQRQAAAMASALATRLPWDNRTALGRPVVPEV